MAKEKPTAGIPTKADQPQVQPASEPAPPPPPAPEPQSENPTPPAPPVVAPVEPSAVTPPIVLPPVPSDPQQPPVPAEPVVPVEPVAPAKKRFKLLLAEMGSHVPPTVVEACDRHDAVEVYFKLCGVRSAEGRPSIEEVSADTPLGPYSAK